METIGYVSKWGHPVGWLIVVALLLAWLAGHWQTYPTPRMVIVATVVAVASLLTLWWPAISFALAGLNIAWLASSIFDAWQCPRASQFQVRRRTGKIVSLQKSHPVTLEIAYFGRRRITFQLVDDIPFEFAAVPHAATVTLDAESRATVRYRLQASRRGAFSQEFLSLRVPSRLGLWCRFLRIACPSSLQVYPDLRQMEEYLLLARTNRLALMGVRRTRKIGQDHEFERLRDYTPDDQFKHIDWRSTARRQKLTVRDYQSSQSQRLVFMIDCGRMMHQHVAGLSLLDHALNACLMLSYVALRQGDAAGMMLFGGPGPHVCAAGGWQESNESPAEGIVRHLSPDGRNTLRPGISALDASLSPSGTRYSGDQRD